MRRTEIQLSKSFEDVLASLLTLPSRVAEIGEVRFAGATDSELRQSAGYEAEVKGALRSLYEAAHGRQVETPIGLLPIAPPVAAFLKKKPYYVATQHEFFLEALTRILVGDSPRKRQTNRSCPPGSKRATSCRGINGPRSHTRKVNGDVSFALHRRDLRATNN
jgi:hypothetical protein